MLSDFTPVTTLAVKDLQTVRRFYESVLGFTAPTDAGEGVFYTAGNSRFFIYRSQYAGTNQATAMSFQIPANTFDTEVAGLREAGVTFDTFDALGVTWDDGVATIGEGMRGVWFNDPDGNILNVDTRQAVTPYRCAMSTACTRSRASSFARMLRTCVLTVAIDTTRRLKLVVAGWPRIAAGRRIRLGFIAVAIGVAVTLVKIPVYAEPEGVVFVVFEAVLLCLLLLAWRRDKRRSLFMTLAQAATKP